MNVERLERLVKYFENEFPKEWIEKGKFNLDQWMTATNPLLGIKDVFDEIKSENDLIVLEPKYCQTHGCIMGWATTIPEFKKDGLHLTVSSYSHRYSTIWFEGKTDFDAAAEFFNITNEEAEYLFDPSSYDEYEELHDPKYAVARIKEVIAIGFPEKEEPCDWEG